MHIRPEKSEDTWRRPAPAAIIPMSCLIRQPVTQHAFVPGVGGPEAVLQRRLMKQNIAAVLAKWPD